MLNLKLNHIEKAVGRVTVLLKTWVTAIKAPATVTTKGRVLLKPHSIGEVVGDNKVKNTNQPINRLNMANKAKLITVDQLCECQFFSRYRLNWGVLKNDSHRRRKE